MIKDNLKVLQESVEHLEDLPIDRFIQSIESIGRHQVTERPLGINACFGLDASGRLYIARSTAPDADKFYSVKEVPPASSEDAFRSALQAVLSVKHKITNCFIAGDTTKCVLLFHVENYSKNTTNPSKSAIVLTTPTLDTPHNRFNSLVKSLNETVVASRTTSTTSDDGLSTSNRVIHTRWAFKKAESQSVDSFRISSVHIVLNALKEYLNQSNTTLPGLSNWSILQANLNDHSREDREAVRDEREKVSEYVFNNFKFPIKNILVKQILRRMKSSINDGTRDVISVVLASPRYDDVKVVDKTTFDLINNFRTETIYRCSAQVKSVNTLDALSSQGGIVGQCKANICEKLGDRTLAMPSTARAFIRGCVGDSYEFTENLMAKKLIPDASVFTTLKMDLETICRTGCMAIRNIISDFKTSKIGEKLASPTGEVEKLSPVDIERTLTVAAESYAKLRDMADAIRACSQPVDIIKTVFGSSIDKVMKESKEGLQMNQLNEDEGGAEVAPNLDPTSSNDITMPPVAMFLNGMYPALKARKPLLIQYTKKHARKKVAKHINEALDTLESPDLNYLTENYDFNSLTQTRQRLAMLKQNLERMDKNVPVKSRDLRAYFDTYANLAKFKRTEEFAIELDTGEIVKLYIGADQAYECKNAIQSMINRGLNFDNILKSITGVYDVVDAEVIRTADEIPPHNFQLVSDTAYKFTTVSNPLGDVSSVKYPKQATETLNSLLTESADVVASIHALEKHNAVSKAVLRITQKPYERLLLALLLKIGVPAALIMESRFHIKARLSAHADILMTNQRARLYAEYIVAFKHNFHTHVLKEDIVDVSDPQSVEMFRANTEVQKIVLAVMLCLGFNKDKLLKYKSVMAKQLKDTDRILTTHATLKNAFVGIFSALMLEAMTRDDMTDFDMSMPDGINRI